MYGRLGLLAMLLLVVPAVPLAFPVDHAGPAHLSAVTTVWPPGTTADFSGSELAPVLPAVAPHPMATGSTTTSGYYYVGADSEVSSVLSNSGVGATIQVVSTAVTTGCLSFWVADDSSASIWGQVGYYLCNGSVPVAFYQIWNLNTYAVLVTGTTAVTTGSHRFSMYSQSGSTWAFSLDGSIFGTYNMGSSVSSSTYPVEALSEEGSVSTPWNPPQVQFSQIQVMGAAGAWASVSSGFVPYGCGSSSYSCWGAAGDAQSLSIPDGAVTVGGSTPSILSGSVLWNGVSTTTTSTTSTTTTTASSSSSTTTTTAASVTSSSTVSSTTTASSSANQIGTLSVVLTVSPSSNTRRSMEYFTVKVNNQNGSPVGGASVTLSVVRPDGRVITSSGTTDSAGMVSFQYKLNAIAPLGTYSVSATATSPGYLSGSAKGTFTVN